MQSLGKIVQRVPAVGSKMWCLSLFFCLSRSYSPERRAFEGCIVRTRIALPFIGRFRRDLEHFFHKRLLFQTRYINLTFVARWRHNCHEIALKNREVQKSAEKFVRTTSYS